MVTPHSTLSTQSGTGPYTEQSEQETGNRTQQTVLSHQDKDDNWVFSTLVKQLLHILMSFQVVSLIGQFCQFSPALPVHSVSRTSVN